MLHGWLVDCKHLEQELVADAALQKKDIIPDKFIDEILSQLRRDLKSVDPEGKQDFDDTFQVTLLLRLDELVLVLGHDGLAEELGAIGAALRGEDLVVLVQLYFVVFDRLGEGGRICQNVAIPDVM